MEKYNIKKDNYESEVKEKWGSTEQYKEYIEKTKKYTNENWSASAEEMYRIFAKFAECMNVGKAFDSVDVLNLVGELQKHITTNYYQCTNDILLCLGKMYVEDKRFKENIEKHSSGTAAFVYEAIKTYCNNC